LSVNVWPWNSKAALPVNSLSASAAAFELRLQDLVLLARDGLGDLPRERDVVRVLALHGGELAAQGVELAAQAGHDVPPDVVGALDAAASVVEVAR
jgi:hypothetical protein